eukprot:gnl/TRDRNA2_/TRDRNA2_154160_c0_seq2.p2 gnl/TRDRNA2_/TRDRNA2_154160_c0~~gnl/TRDRNA2_/TRDRNA2_154160_c0_seq2.p2  ORF type:complete len:147 (-),score=14.72 gnl/TRDRNA2_/TRDRNA2_154160_c0_seq2:19-459(-)
MHFFFPLGPEAAAAGFAGFAAGFSAGVARSTGNFGFFLAGPFVELARLAFSSSLFRFLSRFTFPGLFIFAASAFVASHAALLASASASSLALSSLRAARQWFGRGGFFAFGASESAPVRSPASPAGFPLPVVFFLPPADLEGYRAL